VIDCILNWSALQGSSRHQWGTETDLVDAAAMPHGYKPKLLPEEVSPGGIFHPLHCWLNENISKYEFFSLYKTYSGGMYPEPWHLSYAPLSAEIIKLVSPELLCCVTAQAEILGKEMVLEPNGSDLQKSHSQCFNGNEMNFNFTPRELIEAHESEAKLPCCLPANPCLGPITQA
jgi:hypothetical protein